MGQYQQWLLAQEIDQRLKAEIEAMETELLYLKDRIVILEHSVPETENVVLQALTAYLTRGEAEERAVHGLSDSEELSIAQASRSTDAVPAHFVGLHPDVELSPDEMLVFFDEHQQTDPRLPTAWLQRNHASRIDDEGRLVDDETQRLNDSIQRWFTRWRRRVTNVASSKERSNEQ